MPRFGKVCSRAARAVGFKYSSFKRLLSYRKRVPREHSTSSAVKNFSQLKNSKLSICSAGLSSISLMCLLLNNPDFNTSHSNDSGRNSLMFFRRCSAVASAISGPKAAPSAITRISFTGASVMQLQIFDFPPALMHLILLFLHSKLKNS